MTADSFKIPEDEIDDLLYYARAGETADLLGGIDRIKTRSNQTVADILLAVKDAQSENTVLHMAAANGYLGMFKIKPHGCASSPHAFVSCKNIAGNTALHWASLNGHLEVVKALVLEAHADPTLPNLAGHDAIYEAELNDKKDVVDWVLGHCENIEEGISEKPDLASAEISPEEPKDISLGHCLDTKKSPCGNKTTNSVQNRSFIFENP
ncbi:ankyrin repeat-containing protein YAR1 [Geopyxis carbonaria]|nr:ankyrin repeat-containing protein YAR1 [Geopyxis carbonaria]